MSTDPDMILLETEDAMSKALDYLKNEFRGIRTGRASTALVDYLKVDYYGSMTELKGLAAVSVPEPTQLLIRPFDTGAISAIKTAIESSGLGVTPVVEAKQIRLNIPPLSAERRQQLVARVKKMGEEQKVAIRNVRRDGNKHAEALAKAASALSKDQIDALKEEIQELLKKHEEQIDARIEEKVKEITTI